MTQSFVPYPGIAYPQVVFDPSNSQFTLRGDSFMLLADEFYGQLKQKLRTFLKSSQLKPPIACYFDLDYYDTKSFKCVYNLLALLQESGKKIDVHWKIHFHDYASLETAIDLQGDFPRLNFVFD
ncbi:MAG TPA: hypothetical protein DCS93_21125 [Microscillaceae bacterium]|nr:hypothetical protein [Microscillaceae bacterium]